MQVATVHSADEPQRPDHAQDLGERGQEAGLDVARDVERRVVAGQQRVGLEQVDLQHDDVDADAPRSQQRGQLDAELAGREARDRNRSGGAISSHSGRST